MAHPGSFSSPSISFRVMSFIEKSVARLDQQDRLEALALELGKSHYHYNAPPKYYSVRPPVIPTVINSLVLWCSFVYGAEPFLILTQNCSSLSLHSMNWCTQTAKWAHALTYALQTMTMEWHLLSCQGTSTSMSIWPNYFPVCRSGIHLCRAAHPEGEVDGRAGGGMEGEERDLMWVLIRDLYRGPLLVNALSFRLGVSNHSAGVLECVRLVSSHTSFNVPRNRPRWGAVQHKPDWCVGPLNHTWAYWEHVTTCYVTSGPHVILTQRGSSKAAAAGYQTDLQFIWL